MNIEEAVKWYTGNRSTYKALSNKVSEIIEDVLDHEKIEYYTITNRAKEIDSFRKKAENEKYNDQKEIKDLAGIRVITYVESEALKVANIIKNLFDINNEESIDKSKILGVDKFGYRSIHYIAKFSSERSKLPEFKKFSDFEFEIQIRTILQHAWAEIEHDRNYKYRGILPDNIKRRFAILAGVLELTDREFDQISTNINVYKSDIANKTKRGDLDIEINSTALIEFLTTKYNTAISAGLEPSFYSADDEIIQELHDFGINTLKELNDIILEDRVEKVTEFGNANFTSLIRMIMILKDKDRYFKNAWNRNWGNLQGPSQKLLQFYGIDVKELAEKYNFSLFE